MTTLLAYALIVAYFVVERSLRKDKSALSLQPDSADADSSGLLLFRPLRTAADQQIIDKAPYNLIGHPGYLGRVSARKNLSKCVRQVWQPPALQACSQDSSQPASPSGEYCAFSRSPDSRH